MIETPPGWLPNNNASVDPQLKTDLSEIKEHPPTQQEYMPRIVEKLKLLNTDFLFSLLFEGLSHLEVGQYFVLRFQ